MSLPDIGRLRLTADETRKLAELCLAELTVDDRLAAVLSSFDGDELYDLQTNVDTTISEIEDRLLREK